MRYVPPLIFIPVAKIVYFYADSKYLFDFYTFTFAFLYIFAHFMQFKQQKLVGKNPLTVHIKLVSCSNRR